MANWKIISNLYSHITHDYPFWDYIGFHRKFDCTSIDRDYYRIIDLELWFKSDFQEGEELFKRRVSESAKYDIERCDDYI